jgi:hypothetical protein
MSKGKLFSLGLLAKFVGTLEIPYDFIESPWLVGTGLDGGIFP